MVINIALYYPYIEPPASWLKRSLLLFESVSSIVPENSGPPSPDLSWLEREGAWRPTYASELVDKTYRDDIETALMSFAQDRRYKFNKSFPSPSLVDRLYIGKLGYEIEDTLLELQLAKPGHHPYLIVHRDVQTLVLAVTAKYLAAQSVDVTSRMIPVTDVRLSADHAFSALRETPLVDQCLELALTGLLPTPGSDASLEDVIAFRQSHELAVLEFRGALRLMMTEVGASDQPIEVIREFREQIEESIAAFSAATKQKRLTMIAGSGVVLLAGAAASMMEPSTVHWVFDGLGPTAAVALAGRRVRRTVQRADQGPFSYLLEAAKAFGG